MVYTTSKAQEKKMSYRSMNYRTCSTNVTGQLTALQCVFCLVWTEVLQPRVPDS